MKQSPERERGVPLFPSRQRGNGSLCRPDRREGDPKDNAPFFLTLTQVDVSPGTGGTQCIHISGRVLIFSFELPIQNNDELRNRANGICPALAL